MFCARSARNGAVDAGSEGCVVSGLWIIACCSSGDCKTWYRSTVLSRLSGRPDMFRKRRTSCPSKYPAASHRQAVVSAAGFALGCAGLRELAAGRGRAATVAEEAMGVPSVESRGRLNAPTVWGAAVAG
jgi:hypothetical protein